ncbi:MAG: VOC family protein [Spirochaetia bacterium]|jgi:predicted enzyme related to lactoylglutathione lyase
MPVRYVHTSIVARDWKSLSRFYVRALGCKPKPPERNLKGKWLDSATSLRGVHIQGIHLTLPGYGADGPTLEVFQYSKERTSGAATTNKLGYSHLAFAVQDVAKALEKIERHGGGRVGEVVSAEIVGVGPINFVYARDPEGNIIELQKWG